MHVCECRSTFNLGDPLFELAPLDLQRDRGALALVDRHENEGGHADDVQLGAFKVTARDRDGFDGLIDRARADGLNLGLSFSRSTAASAPATALGLLFAETFSVMPPFMRSPGERCA